MPGFGNPQAERRAIERTYEDTCSIYGFEDYQVGNIDEKRRALLWADQPCALSQTSLKTTQQGAAQNDIEYDAKLFLAPELEIPPGAEIDVTRFGRLFTFSSVGVAFVYATHQELMLRNRGRA